MKFCKDCRFCAPDYSIASLFGLLGTKLELAKCLNPQSGVITRTDLVSGKVDRWQAGYCSVQRKYRCGEGAAWFGPKQPVTTIQSSATPPVR
jgi:hypothetical protein